MSGRILMISLVVFLWGVGMIRYGYTIPPRETCLTLGQQPRKEYRCTPGQAGADVQGPQGSPGRDCYPIQDTNGSFVCTYTVPNPAALQYTQTRSTLVFEGGLYVFWAFFVAFTVYTFKQTPMWGGIILTIAVFMVLIVNLMLPQ